MSCDLGSPAVDEASERCEGAIEGARVGAALQVDMRVEARLAVLLASMGREDSSELVMVRAEKLAVEGGREWVGGVE